MESVFYLFFISAFLSNSSIMGNTKSFENLTIELLDEYVMLTYLSRHEIMKYVLKNYIL